MRALARRLGLQMPDGPANLSGMRGLQLPPGLGVLGGMRAVYRLGGVVLALVSACGAADEDLRTEVVSLAGGEYFGARWGGTQVQRFYAVAWRGTPQAPDGHAVVVSADHEEPCDLGTNVSRYTSLRPQSASKYVIGSPSPARITLLEDVDEDGFGTLRFADIDCKRIDLSVSDVDKRSLWYLYDPDQTHLKFAVRNRGGKLIFVDPWAQTQQEVAENVAALQTFESGEWLIEGEQLVKRDLDGNELLRRGSKVTSLLMLNSKGDLVYHDAGGIYTLRSGKATRIAKTGCTYLNNLDAFIPGAIGYFAEPCDDSRLRVAASEDKTYEYGEHVTAISSTANRLVYTTSDGSMTKLWLVDSSDPMQPKAVGEYERFVLRGIAVLPGNLVVLVSTEADDTLTVWQIERNGDDVHLTELTRGLVSYSRSDSGIALQYDTGELILADGSIDRVLLRVPVPRQARYQFIMGGKALGLVYLTNVDPDTSLGSLELQLLSGAHYVLAQHVREFEYVWWPERGISYVAGGPNPGIRFARIDIPCEATSDAPWACGL